MAKLWNPNQIEINEFETMHRWRQEIIDLIAAFGTSDHARLHDMDGTLDHTPPGGTEDNIVLFDAAGYPIRDSAIADSDLVLSGDCLEVDGTNGMEGVVEIIDTASGNSTIDQDGNFRSYINSGVL